MDNDRKKEILTAFIREVWNDGQIGDRLGVFQQLRRNAAA